MRISSHRANGALMRLLAFVIAVAVPVELWAGERKTAWACHAADNPQQAGEAFGANADRLINLYVYDACAGEVPPGDKPACGVTYEKNGHLKTLWEADNDKDYCQPHAEALADTLEQAGFDCATVVATPACPDGLEKKASVPAQVTSTVSPPPSENVFLTEGAADQKEVDAYLNLVRTLAAAGDVRFERELEGLMAEAAFFREHWEDVKKSAVMKRDLQVWVVQSAYCSRDACASIVVQPLPSASDFSELELVDVFEGPPTLTFVDCVSVNGVRACWRDATNRPIYHERNLQGHLSAGSLYLYDSKQEQYATYLTCRQNVADEDQAHAYELFSPRQPGELLASGISEYEKVCEGVLLNVLLHNAIDSFAQRSLFASNNGSN